MSAAGVPEAVAGVEPRQRTHAVDAVGEAERLEVRRLEVGILHSGLADEIGVLLGRHLILHNHAVGVAEAQPAIVKLVVALAIHETGVHGRRGAEIVDLLLELPQDILEEADGPPGDAHRLRQVMEDPVADVRPPAAR